uniref:Uncharacterized protein n=1 Tax=Populus alba TaxID=43335 RepID=A0A4U5MYP0_POPAL|nr:hypothetical protein D5086_0000288360 [Populus alba]
MVAAMVGLGGGRSGAKLTERAASGAGEEMAGGLWLARRGKMRGKMAAQLKTGNGRFGFVLGLRGKESFWLARGENETEGKRLESGRRECAGAVSGAVGWRRGRFADSRE